MDTTPIVTEVLLDSVARAFNMNYILSRQDLNADQKLGYLNAVNEVINCLRNWKEEREEQRSDK